MQHWGLGAVWSHFPQPPHQPAPLTPLSGPCPFPYFLEVHPTSPGGLSIHQTGDHLQRPPPWLSCPGCLLPSPCGILSKQDILSDHTALSDLCLLSSLPFGWTLTSTSFSSARKSSLSLRLKLAARGWAARPDLQHSSFALPALLPSPPAIASPARKNETPWHDTKRAEVTHVRQQDCS